jgi:hypothetical protein
VGVGWRGRGEEEEKEKTEGKKKRDRFGRQRSPAISFFYNDRALREQTARGFITSPSAGHCNGTDQVTPLPPLFHEFVPSCLVTILQPATLRDAPAK